MAETDAKFQWPILKRGSSYKTISSTFGETRHNHYHNGLDIASYRDNVYPVSSGNFLFSYHRTDDPYRPQRGAGNFVILSHPGERLSGYYHLDEIHKLRNGPVTTDTAIGTTGNSGFSYGAHLHFFICSDSGLRCENPLNLLPERKDTNPPQIGNLYIFTSDNYSTIRSGRETKINYSGAYPIYVALTDPGQRKTSRRGIYNYTWQLNDGPITKITFDELIIKPQGWLLESRYELDDLYHSGKYILGTPRFTAGLNTITITARDHNGNESKKVFTLNIIQ